MANGSLDAPYEGASIEAANIAEALQKAKKWAPQSRSRITPGFRYFLMAAAFAALSLDRSDHRKGYNQEAAN
jgi:hypothetical protein